MFLVPALLLQHCAVSSACRAGDPGCQPDLMPVLFYGSSTAFNQTSSSSCQNRSFCTVYLTADTPNPFGPAFTGIAGADAFCQASPNRPSHVVQAKAFLVGTGVRIASVSANAGDGQIDWVLFPGKEYRKADGVTVIGTTLANRLLSLPLNSGFSFIGDTLQLTGMNPDWTFPAGGDCAGWTGGGTNAGVSFGDSVDAGALNGGTLLCSSGPVKLRCVEQ